VNLFEPDYVWPDRDRAPAHPVIKVSLTTQQVNETLSFFYAIMNYNKEHNIREQKVAQDGRHITKEGLMGETAFGAVFGLKRAYDVGLFKGFDFVVPSGLFVDVKQADFHDRGMIVELSTDPENPRTDLYCFVTGRNANYTIQGYAWADEVLVPERINPKLPKKAYYTVKHQLRDPRDLALPTAPLIMGCRLGKNGRIRSRR